MNLTFLQIQPRLILIIICDYQHVYLYELLISIIWKLWEDMWAASRVRHWRPEQKSNDDGDDNIDLGIHVLTKRVNKEDVDWTKWMHGGNT